MASDNVLPNLEGLPNVSGSVENMVRAYCIYDSAAGIGVDANTSNVAQFSPMIQLEPSPSGTIFAIQVKVHRDAQWIEIWRSKDDAPSFIMTYQMPYNFLRVVRVSGTGHSKAFATVFPTDFMG